jgi:hypothetical protein
VIFDNVGGATLDALLPHLARHARIVPCGAISRHDGGPAPLRNWFCLLPGRALMQGFIYLDQRDRFDEIEADLLPRLRSGELRSREHVVKGLTAAPAALEMLFDGRNTGKLLVRVGAASPDLRHRSRLADEGQRAGAGRMRGRGPAAGRCRDRPRDHQAGAVGGQVQQHRGGQAA